MIAVRGRIVSLLLIVVVMGLFSPIALAQGVTVTASAFQWHEASHLHTCLELVAAGLGVTVLPAVPGRESVVCRTLDPAPPSLEFVFAYRDDLSPEALRDVLRAAREAVRTPA